MFLSLNFLVFDIYIVGIVSLIECQMDSLEFIIFIYTVILVISIILLQEPVFLNLIQEVVVCWIRLSIVLI